MEKETLSMAWQGLAVDVECTPNFSPVFQKMYGRTLVHLAIERRGKGRLPITDTGFRSHFTTTANIEGHGGSESYVRAWLEEGAKSKAWQEYIQKERQLKLF